MQSAAMPRCAPARLHRPDQRPEDARAARADGVPERDGAAADVDPRRRRARARGCTRSTAPRTPRSARRGRGRFARPAGPRERLLARGDRPLAHQARVRRRPSRAPRRARAARASRARTTSSLATSTAARAVVERRAVARR